MSDFPAIKRPSIGTYLLGNTVSMLAALVGGAWLCLAWWVGRYNGFAPIVGIVVIVAAFNANDKLRSFNTWKRAWDALGDTPPRRRSTWWKKPLAVLIWLSAAFFLFSMDPKRVQTGIAVDVFAVATVFLLGRAFYRLVRKPGRQKQEKDSPVLITLHVPRGTSDAGLAKDLPAYCAGFLRE